MKLRGEQGSGPKGVDDLCFHTYGEFSPSPPSSNLDFGLWAEIWASRLDLGVQAGIWASRLGFKPQGWHLGLEAGI